MVTFCLTLSSGWLSGFGALLLIPMLDAIGAGGAPEPHGLSARVTRAFQRIGLSPSLHSVLLVFLVLTAGQALLVRCQTLRSASLQQEITEILRNRLYEAVSHCNWLFFTKKRSSDFIYALTADIGRVTNSIITLLNLVSTVVLVGVHVLLSLFISPWMSLAVLTTLAICWPLLTRQHRAASRTGHTMSETMSDLFSRINEHLGGMKQIKSLGAESRHVPAFRSVTESVKQANLRYNRAAANTAMIFSFGSAALLSGLLLAAVELLQFRWWNYCC